MRRLCVLLVGLILVAVPAADSRAALAAPGWQSLLGAVTGSPQRVPGLALPIAPDKSGAGSGAVSPARCVQRWSSGAPRTTRAWAAHHGTRADVTVMTSTNRTTGSTIVQCAYGVDVGSTRLALVVAPLAGSTAPWRGEMRRYAKSATRNRLLSRFNATVTRAGALRLR